MRLTKDQIQTAIQESPALRRELEKYYRRGYSQGVAAAAYADAAGATAPELEAFRKRVYQWRCDLPTEPVAPSWSQWSHPELQAASMTEGTP